MKYVFVALFLTCNLSLALGSIYQDTLKINSTDPLYFEDCLIDPAKGNVDENYDFSCLTDAAIEAEQNKCCQEPGSDNKGCCDNSNVKGVGDPQKMIQLVTILVCCTVSLMIVVFVCTWCDKKTFPCLETLEARLKACWEKTEEHIPCCAKKVEKKKTRIELEEQGVPQYDLPDEYNQPIQDDFFGVAVDDTPVVLSSSRP